jgi:hypothetical protein
MLVYLRTVIIRNFKSIKYYMEFTKSDVVAHATATNEDFGGFVNREPTHVEL